MRPPSASLAVHRVILAGTTMSVVWIFLLFFVSARTIKRHHHLTRRSWACLTRLQCWRWPLQSWQSPQRESDRSADWLAHCYLRSCTTGSETPSCDTVLRQLLDSIEALGLILCLSFFRHTYPISPDHISRSQCDCLCHVTPYLPLQTRTRLTQSHRPHPMCKVDEHQR
jgi:hypothetical protein